MKRANRKQRAVPIPRPYTFQVIIEQDEAGYFVAECPALKACYTQGKTFEEAIKNIKDVIALCLAEAT